MTQTIRPDLDIEEDIRGVIAHYPPLQADRHHLSITVQNGDVTVQGHVRSLISRGYLIEHVGRVPGVRALESSRLFCDEAIRMEAGQRIPTGVIANAVYGVVILTGTRPESVAAETIVAGIAQIPGVVRVVTKF